MAASPAEFVDWIDDDNRTLASLPRAEIRARNLLHRTTATFVFHPDGRIFVHQRSPAKDVYPGLFDPFVGGTVVSGESYEENACRELAEELGVRGVHLHPLFGHRFADGSTNNRIQVFACVYDGTFRFQPEEVVAGDWCDEAEVERRIAAGQVCPDSAQGWQRYLAAYGPGRNFARDLAPQFPALDCSGALDGA